MFKNSLLTLIVFIASGCSPSPIQSTTTVDTVFSQTEEPPTATPIPTITPTIIPSPTPTPLGAGTALSYFQ